MKKLFLIFMMFSIFLLIGCEKNTENKKELIENTSREKSEVIYNSTECKSDMKLWVNKTYNFFICIPKNWGKLDEYSGNVSYDLTLFDDSTMIGDGIYNAVFMGLEEKGYFGKYDKKSTFGDKEIIEHYFINNDGKKEFSEFEYILQIGKGKYYGFSLRKQTEEIKNILESIKVLNEFKKNENKGKDSIKELKYERIIDYSKMDIKNITKEFLKNDIEDEYILVDLQFEKSHKKLEKILNIINILSKEGKIDSFELHCKNLNFNKNELKILENVNIKKLFLEDMCGFKKDKFTQTWYDKQKVIKFLKQAKYIKEIEIGYIDTDLFLKENGEIKVYR